MMEQARKSQRMDLAHAMAHESSSEEMEEEEQMAPTTATNPYLQIQQVTPCKYQMLQSKTEEDCNLVLLEE